jgi:hypothetical protein
MKVVEADSDGNFNGGLRNPAGDLALVDLFLEKPPQIIVDGEHAIHNVVSDPPKLLLTQAANFRAHRDRHDTIPFRSSDLYSWLLFFCRHIFLSLFLLLDDPKKKGRYDRKM